MTNVKYCLRARRQEYRQIIRRIVKNAMQELLPGVKNKKEMADVIAKNVHARLYGADVDGVKSPLWRDMQETGQATLTAQELLECD